MAIKTGTPIIQIKNSKGGVLEEGLKLIEGFGEVAKKSVMASYSCVGKKMLFIFCNSM